MGSYLKSWAYKPQKPISKAFEQITEKVMEWLKKEYPAIKKRASNENAVIYFGDETGMQCGHYAGWCAASTGETLVVKRTRFGFWEIENYSFFNN